MNIFWGSRLVRPLLAGLPSNAERHASLQGAGVGIARASQPDRLELSGQPGHSPYFGGACFSRNVALRNAARKGDQEKVERLISQGAKINAQSLLGGETPLIRAIRGGHANLIRILLAAGASVHIPDKILRMPPLCFAAGGGDPEIVQLLLEKDANPNGQGKYSALRPLRLAATGGHLEATRVLLEHGAIPGDELFQVFNAQHPMYTEDDEGRLYLASGEEHTDQTHRELPGLLLQYGADPDSTLHEAVEQGCTEMVRLLLEYGADPERENDEGQTPLSLAEENEHAETIDILKENQRLRKAGRFQPIQPLRRGNAFI